MLTFGLTVVLGLGVADAFPNMGSRLGVRDVARSVDSATSSSTGSSSGGVAPAGHKYVAPGPNDLRSPCPGLNALANHNFLPHDGRGLTVDVLVKGLSDGLNVSPDFSITIGGFGSLSSPGTTTFTLQDLDHHNFPIEHDASLSRLDFYEGNNYAFNNATWQTVLAYVPGNGADPNAVFNYSNAGPARYNRVKTQAKKNPTFTYTPLQFVLSYGETALYLSTMGDPSTGVAKVSYVRSLFEKERLPYELGWTKPAGQTSLFSLGAMIFALNAATGEPVPEGLILGESTLRLALAGLDPISGLPIPH
ncbi:hypothetical protein PYCC9005_005148 [Savitreella phatthalungensis]